MKLLVTYASKYGSTAEIAEVIGKELGRRAYEVEVTPVESVQDVTGYDGFVIGSALYAGGWIEEAANFLKANQKVLAKHPVWLFSSGPTGEGDPNDIMDGWQFPEDLSSVVEKVKPKDIILFHGNIDLDKLSGGERMIIQSVKATVGDYRDWLVIRSWARAIDLQAKTE